MADKNKKDDKDKKKDKKEDKKDKKGDKEEDPEKAAKKAKKAAEKLKEEAREIEETRVFMGELDALFRDADTQVKLIAIGKLKESDRMPALRKLVPTLATDQQTLVANLIARRAAKKEMADKVSKVDWAEMESIMTTWPPYAQAAAAAEKAGGSLSKNVVIDPFDMRVPYSQKYLIQNAVLQIDANRRVCLHGEPGTGKSVLFNHIAAVPNYTAIKGFPAHVQVHLCQEIEISSDAMTVNETVVNMHPMIFTLRNNKKALEGRIAENTKWIEEGLTEAPEVKNPEDDDEEQKTEKPKAKRALKDELELLQKNLHLISMRLDSLGNRDAEERAAKMLRVLGFDDEQLTKSTNTLSGGLRMRVALCASFFMEPDLLLLDEPTNHLDFPSVLWLENRLRAFRKSFLLVSHDRDMLDKVTTDVIEIDKEKKCLVNWPCSFGAFEKKKAQKEKEFSITVEKFLTKHRNVDSASALARTKADYQAWQDAYYAREVLLKGMFSFPTPEPLRQFTVEEALNADGSKAAAVENKVEKSADNVLAEKAAAEAAASKKKEKVDPKKKDEKKSNLPDIDIDIIKVDTVRFSYNAGVLPWIFDTPISFSIKYSPVSTRVGVMGPNGAGKSTFLKLLTGRLTPVSGKIVRHPTAKIGYFAQHHTAELDLSKTPIEYMQQHFPKENTGVLRKQLGKIGITGQLTDTRLKGLTHGQRSCVMFAKITLECPHLLIMDEPTNFLDLASVDALINATNKYEGALLLVSHNRSFLLRCATQFLSIVPGQFNLYSDLKSCEQATYTFIQELESGVHVSGGNLLANQKKHVKAGQETGEAKSDAPSA